MPKRCSLLATVVAAAALLAGSAATGLPAAHASLPGGRRAALDVTGWKLATPAAPTPTAANGIGPGDYLLITRPDGLFICTANFVWADTAGNRYLGAAGHCFLPQPDVTGGGPVPDSGQVPSAWRLEEARVTTVTLGPRRAAVLLH